MKLKGVDKPTALVNTELNVEGLRKIIRRGRGIRS
jgi:hypothetical protein